jgi:hypothetical protein
VLLHKLIELKLGLCLSLLSMLLFCVHQLQALLSFCKRLLHCLFFFSQPLESLYQFFHNLLLKLPVFKLYFSLKISKRKFTSYLMDLNVALSYKKIVRLVLTILEKDKYFLKILLVRNVVIDAAFVPRLNDVFCNIIVWSSISLDVSFVIKLVKNHIAEQFTLFFRNSLLFLVFYLVQNSVIF